MVERSDCRKKNKEQHNLDWFFRKVVNPLTPLTCRHQNNRVILVILLIYVLCNSLALTRRALGTRLRLVVNIRSWISRQFSTSFGIFRMFLPLTTFPACILKMASKVIPSSRAEIQQAIKAQGEIIRHLKLEDQTDEIKNKVLGQFHCLLSLFLSIFALFILGSLAHVDGANMNREKKNHSCNQLGNIFLLCFFVSS